MDHCPCCGKRVDLQYSPEEPLAVPGEGDVTICIGCEVLLTFVFDTDGSCTSLRPLTKDEIDDVAEERSVVMLRYAVRLAKQAMEEHRLAIN